MGKLISNAILAVMAAVVVGLLYVAGYFWVKSGEPMTVAESQALAPGLTFRDFWASRVEQWRASDDAFEKRKGRPGGCQILAYGVTFSFLPPIAIRVWDIKAQDDIEYTRKVLASISDDHPSPELIHETSYLHATWIAFESFSWGVLSHKNSQTCPLTYPTPADVSANRNQETGALP